MRYLIRAGTGELPCIHQDINPDRNELVMTDGVWYISLEKYEPTQKRSIRISEVPIRWGGADEFTFHLRETAKVRPALGHPEVEVRDRDEDVNRLVTLGSLVDRYWDTIRAHRSDESRLERPANSSRYRERASRSRTGNDVGRMRDTTPPCWTQAGVWTKTNSSASTTSVTASRIARSGTSPGSTRSECGWRRTPNPTPYQLPANHQAVTTADQEAVS